MSNPKQKESVYVVDNLKEAYELMHMELGPNAQLSEQKKVRQKGMFSFFKKRKLHVVATVDYESYLRQNEKRGLSMPQAKPKAEYNPNGVEFKTSPSDRFQSQPSPTHSVSPEVVRILEKVIQEKQGAESKATTVVTHEAKEFVGTNPYEKAKRKDELSSKEEEKHPSVSSQTTHEVLNDVKKLNQELEEVKMNMKMLFEMNQKGLRESTVVPSSTYPEWIREYQFSDKVMKELETYLTQQALLPSQLTFSLLRSFVQKSLEEKLVISTIDETKPLVLVGPTGVGKTTTLSKLASRYYQRTDKEVGFITFDVFRIGAVEQLEIYADILHSDIKVVYNAEQLSEAVADLKQGSETSPAYEFILIDSIGRSYRDEKSIQELKDFVEAAQTDQVILVLNASTNYRDIKKIMAKYQDLNYNQLILTKLDESERNENLLNICYEFSYPISFVCTGQLIVDDIEVPSVEVLTNYVLEGVHYD